VRQRSSQLRAGRWPLLPVVPAVVAVIAMATALSIALVGLGQLQRTSDEAAATQSAVLSSALAARLRSTSIEDRASVLAQAARRSGAELLLVDQSGNILVDQGLGQLDEDDVLRRLVAGSGESESKVGRVWFAASPLSPPLEHLSVLSFVRAPLPAEGTIALSRAVALLTALLLGVAVAVAWTFMRAARDDVSFVRRRIADMAEPEEPGSPDAAPASGRRRRAALPIRSLDQVGLLTAALNVLVTRFDAAEHSYRADLERAAALDAERTRFLAGLSHELRTPLNSILGFTHLLESEEDGPLSPGAMEALGMIRHSGEHLRTLIDDILDLSAMETGQLRLSKHDIDLYALAEEVVREARATVKDRALRLDVDGTVGQHVVADGRRMRQVLTNLVSNALKFTAEGQVRVTVSGSDDGVRVTVTDTGRGIEPEHLDTIFKAYRQAGSAAERRGGAGLGLAIARSLVRLHGGSIEVSSELGRGSVFTIVLPHASAESERPAVPSEPRAEGSS
jgi:signal transduction histidine kinase